VTMIAPDENVGKRQRKHRDAIRRDYRSVRRASRIR
jgi:hypothetical protein